MTTAESQAPAAQAAVAARDTAAPMPARVLGERPREFIVRKRSMRVIYRAPRNDEPPLLLANGFGCSAEIFQPFVDRLSPSRGFVCIDPPGIGGSPPPSAPYRFAGLAARIAEVLDGLGVKTFDALGISWGGALAQEIAWRQRRRCRRLVLVSTGALPLLKPRFDVLSEVVWPRRFDPVRGRPIAARLYGGKVAREPGLLDLMKREIPNRGGEFFQQLAIAGWTSLRYLPRLPQPTLVLSGREDQIIPLLSARLLAKLIPHSQLHFFEDGHMGLLTSADVLAPRIERFLAA